MNSYQGQKNWNRMDKIYKANKTKLIKKNNFFYQILMRKDLKQAYKNHGYGWKIKTKTPN